MTYSSEVLADSPLVYFHLDETGSTTPVNSGSASGTPTVGGTNLPTRGQSPAGTIPGSSWKFSNSAGSGYVTLNPVTVPANWTFETWFKKDLTASGDITRELYRNHVSGTSFVQVTVNTNSGYFRVYDEGGTVNGGITLATIVDGNWHHLVVTKNGTTFTFYVDGVAQSGGASGSSATRTGGVYIGSAASISSGVGGWMDEPALYGSILSGTRIAAHYAAGTASASVSKTISAPVATMSTTSPAPVVTATSPNKTISAPVMTVSMGAVTPHSVGAVNPVNITVSGAMTLSVESVLPGSYGELNLPSLADRRNGNNSNTINLFYGDSASRQALFDFGTFSVPTGFMVAAATLYVHGTASATTPSTPVAVRRITSVWTESGTTTPTNTTDGQVASVVLNSTTAFTEYAIDVTDIARSWGSGSDNYGLALVLTNASSAVSVGIQSREATTESYRPRLVVEVGPIPATSIKVTPPAATLNLSAPSLVKILKGTRNITSPATLALSGVVPMVRSGLKLSVPSITPMSLTAPGGHLVNHLTYAGPMELTLFSQNAALQLRYPNTVFAGPAGLSIAMPSGVNINLTTNRLSKTTPMKVGDLRLVGIYQKQSDRYYQVLPATMNSDDVWYEMEDSGSPTTAVDSMYQTVSGQIKKRQNGTYVGTPLFGTDGPQLRKAVDFDGADYLWMVNTVNGTSGYGAQSGNPTEIFPGMAVTIEFSIKTTQRDGTLWVGGGYNNYNSAAMAQHGGQPIQVRLEDGMITLYNRGEYQFHVRKDIADGEWHHIIVSRPLASSELFVDRVDAKDAHPSYGQAFFVNIDGISEYKSYGFDGAKLPVGAELLPYTFLAKTTLNQPGQAATPQNPTDLLAASLRDVVVRLHYAVGPTVAQKLYYEWSNSNVIEVPAVTVDVSFKSPFKARGNVKRMLMVYGAQWGTSWDNNDLTPDRPMFTYFSNLAGFFIDTFANYVETPTGYRQGDRVEANVGFNAFGAPLYYEPKTFMLEDYLVYPVSIVGDTSHPRTKVNSTGPISAAGIITDNPRDKSYGKLVDEHTGLPRFLNLQEDLLEPVTNFDVVTVVNYPWETADDEADRTNFNDSRAGGQNQGGRLYQNSMGLTPSEWTINRDKFRDSVLEAAYSGVNLWIPEYHMAHHLGFIQGYDVHDPQWFMTTDDQNFGVSAWQNRAAEALDKAHLTTGAGDSNNWVGIWGDYYGYAQSLYYRRIVATEPGLTDLPGNEYNNYLERYSYDPWKVNGSAFMYDVLKRPDGLQVGDLTAMSMYPWRPGRPAAAHEQMYRSEIISAKPEGIVGKVIAREQQFYFKGGSTTPIPNPYADNAVTIAAERGTVVRGRPIQGRAFMEFMDTSILDTHIMVDRDKSLWQGDRNKNVSSFDFDTRRYRNVVTVINVGSEGQTIVKWKWNPVGRNYTSFTITQRFFEYELGDYNYLTYVPMQVRGLHWLGQVSDVPAGQNKVYATAMTVKLTMNNTGFSLTRNLNNVVNGVMRTDVEIRQPRNYRDGSIRERAFPMVITLDMRGVGAALRNVGTMELSLASVSPTRALGSGDRITVYLDGDRNITLFLKEDN